MENRNSFWRSSRVLIFGLVAVIVVLGAALIILAIGGAGREVAAEQINALEGSDNECVVCHSRTTPGIVEQYGHSTMAVAGVTCQQCHVVSADYPAAVEHEGSYVLGSPTTAMCEKCHQQEAAQFYASRHSLPAYVAVVGQEDLTPDQLEMYAAVPEGGFIDDKVKARNAIAALEGENLIPFTCLQCHKIGAPAADGSVGQCQKCHLRHEFSLEQVRKPETCNACHIGPDHPQWEIYFESPHGIAYSTSGHYWHWQAEPGTLSVAEFPAPTCAICHMSGFGTAGTTHDVGDRLTWYLFAPVSERRPTWQDNKVRMIGVCLECHNANFIDDYYTAADLATERVNEWVRQSDEIVAPLVEQNLLTSEPFDEPIDFTYFNLWHHYGRTTKFGVWMQGPDYAQWHGAYEVLHDLAELRQMADEKLNAANAAGASESTMTETGQ